MKKAILLIGLLLPLYIMADTPAGTEEIRSKMKDNLTSFQGCYTEGLKTNSKLSGKVVLDWDVDEVGSVKRAEVKQTTLKDKGVESCMVNKLKTIKFPPALAGQVVNVTYPFVFSTGK